MVFRRARLEGCAHAHAGGTALLGVREGQEAARWISLRVCQSASSATRPPPALWQALKAEILAGLFLWYIQSLEEYEARALVLAACPIIAA